MGGPLGKADGEESECSELGACVGVVVVEAECGGSCTGAEGVVGVKFGDNVGLIVDGSDVV